MQSDNEVKVKIYGIRTSLMVQWLRLPTSYVWVAGSIPGWGIKIPHAVGHNQKRKKKRKGNKWEKDINKKENIQNFIKFMKLILVSVSCSVVSDSLPPHRM